MGFWSGLRNLYAVPLNIILQWVNIVKKDDFDYWKHYKNLSLEEFNKIIQTYEYKKDFLVLGMDSTMSEPNIFFSKQDSSRDCDEFARIWFYYIREHPELFKSAWELYLYDKEENKIIPNKLVHMTTIAKTVDNQYILFDYKPYNKVNSFEECLEILRKKYSYQNLTYEINLFKKVV